MKKLMTFLTGITLISNCTTITVACSSQNTTTSDQQTASNIKANLKNNHVTIENQFQTTQTAGVIQAIQTALKTENPTLSFNDITKIVFPSKTTTLTAGVFVALQTEIVVGNVKIPLTIYVERAGTNQEAAEAIAQRIWNPNIVMDASFKSTVDPGYFDQFKYALRSADRSQFHLPDEQAFSVQDLNAMHLPTKPVNFNPGVKTILPLNITADVFKQEKPATVVDNLSYTRAKTDLEKAEAIKNKILPAAVYVPEGTNPDVTDPKTRQAILNTLKTVEPYLTGSTASGEPTGDLSHISFAGHIDPAGNLDYITVNISFPNANATVSEEMKVGLPYNPSDYIASIREQVVDRNITIPADAYESSSYDIRLLAVRKALKEANPWLTTGSDGMLSHISIPSTPFKTPNITAQISWISWKGVTYGKLPLQINKAS